jgi:hypothetical protein
MLVVGDQGIKGMKEGEDGVRRSRGTDYDDSVEPFCSLFSLLIIHGYPMTSSRVTSPSSLIAVFPVPVRAARHGRVQCDLSCGSPCSLSSLILIPALRRR